MLVHNDQFRCDIKCILLLHQRLELSTNDNSNGLLALCRSELVLDPILWAPMTRKERSCCIRWRIGWLPGDRPKPCIRCGYH
ncbi:hypothetical protein BDA99DRAFT_525027 [Phascolomyces articulosus]|uniref:Uncharacterized protein n=1 Tax=Phascolomyces articulosus TaxID=60185 RepID=A0AAD5JZ31_9FUNG|nr:hypothetical protein BDA99DRAFT_525027 [Phascolomyces articulosus]